MKKSEKPNQVNKVTMLGRERAANAIFSILGGELLLAYKRNYDDVLYDRRGENHGNALKQDIKYDYQIDALNRTRPAVENFDFVSKFELLDQCLEVVLRVYCDPDLDDERLNKALLEIKQFQERKRMNRSGKTNENESALDLLEQLNNELSEFWESERK